MSVRSHSQTGQLSKSRISRPKTTLSGSAPIEVYPPEIIFKDIEPEQTYEIMISVRNLSKNVRRIRFVPPKTSKFLAEYETLGSIAGGISTTVIVSFETDVLGNFHDELIIISEDFTYTLLMHAYQPGPDIQFNKFVDMGLTPVGQPLHSTVQFTNVGSRLGKVIVNIDKNNRQLTVTPESFAINPDDTVNVNFIYNPKEVEVFRDPVLIEVEGQETALHIDVNATCVEHQMCIVAPNMELVSKAVENEFTPGANLAVTTSLNFGHLYHGQAREIDAFLFNNGPIGVPFNIRFIQGSEEDAESETYVTSTPQEIAKLELKRVMKAEPNSGFVEPYSRIPIKFTCHSRINDRAKGFNHNALEEGISGDISASDMVDNVIDHFYTAIFTFGDALTQRLFLQLQARALYPNIKIQQNSIFFPPCPVYEQRDFLIKIDNMNDELPVDFNFTKAAQFTIDPDKGMLFPQQSKSLTFTFKPNNLGVFHEVINIKLIKSAYSLPFHLYGKCTGIGQRQKQLRGPESNKEHFEPKRKYVSDQDASLFALESNQKSKQKAEPIGEQVEQLIMQQLVKQTYVDFLRNSRKQRIAKKKDLGKTQEKPKTLEEAVNSANLGMSENLISQKMIQLPQASDQLHIKKPVGVFDGQPEKKFDPDRPHKNVMKRAIDRKHFVEVPFLLQPTKQAETRECTKELSPEELQYISSGPRIIKFDRVVIGSPVEKWFTVQNDLKQHIFVQLASGVGEITQIQPSSLVIPPGLIGGFKLTFMSLKATVMEGVIPYTINYKHGFNFKIHARVEQAVLKLSKQTLSMVFEDDYMEECLYEKIMIENHCKADTRFQWVLPKNSNFQVEPLDDIVKAEKSRPILIKFTPTQQQNKGEDEILVMKVENGEPCSLRCKGEYTEARCIFLQKSVDFDIVSVGIKHEATVTLKNQLRTTAVFHVKHCPSQIQITPSRDKLKGDGRINLKLEYQPQEPQDLDSYIEVNIRGGKSLTLPITAHAIVPHVYIPESEIDFGGITCKSSAVQKFSIVNDSPISAVVFINLEDHPEFEISLDFDHLKEGEVDTNMMAPAASDRLNPFVLKEDEDELEGIEIPDEEEDTEGEQEEIVRSFRLQLNPHSSIPLQMKFTPNDIETYLFDLPIKMAGISDPIKDLVRPISGEGLQPRFLIDPGIVDFKKKYLSMADKSFPDYKDIIFSNPDLYPVNWRIDTTQMEQNGIFSIRPISGSLEPAASITVRTSFNPIEPTDYEDSAEIYLDNNTEPYLKITLRGEGAVPRISFDRRYVIMPVVPVGITSKSSFRIINEGYQNVELKYRLPRDPGRIPLNVSFPDGQTIGAARTRIPVDISFTADKSISFTANLEFLDDEGNKFTIPIAGTADNCLFTHFQFFQRHPEDFQLQRNEQGAIIFQYDEGSDMEEYSGRWGGPKTSAASSVMSRSVRSIVGYMPIPQVLLEKTLEYLTRWLNHSVLTNAITKFPDDLIQNHGHQLFEIIHHFTGKNAPGMVRNPNSLPTKELTRQLVRQYEELLTYLKQQGALLNTVRPEFLLSQADFARYLKQTPLELQLRPKQIQHRWPYLSMDS